MLKVVGTMFFNNRKLLIDKPRKRPTYQMVGGKVEEGERSLEAAIRECHEELGNKAVFDEKLFEFTIKQAEQFVKNKAVEKLTEEFEKIK